MLDERISGCDAVVVEHDPTVSVHERERPSVAINPRDQSDSLQVGHFRHSRPRSLGAKRMFARFLDERPQCVSRLQHVSRRQRCNAFDGSQRQFGIRSYPGLSLKTAGTIYPQQFLVVRVGDDYAVGRLGHGAGPQEFARSLPSSSVCPSDGSFPCELYDSLRGDVQHVDSIGCRKQCVGANEDGVLQSSVRPKRVVFRRPHFPRAGAFGEEGRSRGGIAAIAGQRDQKAKAGGRESCPVHRMALAKHEEEARIAPPPMFGVRCGARCHGTEQGAGPAASKQPPSPPTAPPRDRARWRRGSCGGKACRDQAPSDYLCRVSCKARVRHG